MLDRCPRCGRYMMGDVCFDCLIGRPCPTCGRQTIGDLCVHCATGALQLEQLKAQTAEIDRWKEELRWIADAGGASRFDELFKESVRLDRFYNDLMGRTVSDALASWDAVRTICERETETMAAAAESWATLALEPQIAFQDFARESMALAEGLSVESQNYVRALVGATGQDVLGPMVESLQLAALMFPPPVAGAEDGEPEPAADEAPEQNVFAELLVSVEIADLSQPAQRASEAVSQSPEASLVQKARRLLELVCEINRESERRNGEQLIKTTTKSLRAASVLLIVAVDEKSFGWLVDHLYFLLYEGSGGNNNRLARLFGRESLKVLWDTKHLRSDARHDLAHGKDSKKKLQRIGTVLESLTGNQSLRSRNDFRRAQVALYERLIAMLEAILDRMANDPDLWNGSEGE